MQVGERQGKVWARAGPGVEAPRERNAVQRSTAQHIIAQDRAANRSTARHSAPFGVDEAGALPHGGACKAQHIIAQHSTAQHSTAHRSALMKPVRCHMGAPANGGEGAARQVQLRRRVQHAVAV